MKPANEIKTMHCLYSVQSSNSEFTYVVHVVSEHMKAGQEMVLRKTTCSFEKTGPLCEPPALEVAGVAPTCGLPATKSQNMSFIHDVCYLLKSCAVLFLLFFLVFRIWHHVASNRINLFHIESLCIV